MSLTLSPADLTDPDIAAQFTRVADAATRVDGYAPFNEQTMLDLAAGRRSAYLFFADEHPNKPVGAAAVGHDGTTAELDLVIAPKRRGHGYGEAALTALLPSLPAVVTAWSHGDHPAARVLAIHHRFVAVRTLLHLQLCPLPPAVASTTDTPARSQPHAPDVTINSFVPGVDDEEWVALNALIFASHPEQGSLTVTDLADRKAEPWFNADDFLVARDSTGRMIGYNWLKIEPAEAADDSADRDDSDADGEPVSGGTGEIYVIGIHPDAAGHGLGRMLMELGLKRLAARGCTAASLYVEADNTGAVHLYRSLGFTDFTIDVQYRRLTN